MSNADFPSPLAGFSVATDILLPSASDLNKKLRFPRTQQVHDLIRDVSRAIAPSSSRVSELIPESTSTTGVGLRRGTDAAPSRGGTSGAGAAARARGEDSWIRTGDEGLDQLLGGGLRIGCVTEITGER
jgi:DNA repair protein RAD57